MKTAFRILNISISLLFIAWIAKLHFIFGGDYLFRVSCVGILLALFMQLLSAKEELQADGKAAIKFFRFHSVGLIIVYLGMMLKVAHLMPDQFLKDLTLDFIGIPAIVATTLYAFSNWSVVLCIKQESRLLFARHLALPWIMFAFSFMVYSIYSLNLLYARA